MTTTQRAEARRRGYSLKQLPDGRWRARVSLPADRDGKVKQLMHTAPLGDRTTDKARQDASRRAAVAWAEGIKQAIANGDYTPKAPDTFTELAAAWLQHKEDTGTRPGTLRGYRTALAPALAAFGDRKVQAVKPTDLRALLAAHKHRARGTNNQMLICVRGVFGLAIDDGLIPAEKDPTARAKLTGRKPKAREELTPADADRIAAHVEGDRLELCWLLTLAGLRRSEVAGLRWSDLDTTPAPDAPHGTIRVERGRVDTGPGTGTVGDMKSERGKRILPLTPDLLAAFKRTRAIRQREALKFGARLHPDAYLMVDEALRPLRPERYSDLWVQLLSDAGVGKPVTLHGARHGSVTRMLRKGVPLRIVARWHGHTPTMTANVYDHPDLDDLRQAADAL